jgi:hypothetical protein
LLEAVTVAVVALTQSLLSPTSQDCRHRLRLPVVLGEQAATPTRV